MGSAPQVCPAGRGVGLEKIKRYYSGVCRRRTTICCSAIALSALMSVALVAQKKKVVAPSELRLFPVRAFWSLALNATLAAPVGFAGTRGSLPMDGHRLA